MNFQVSASPRKKPQLAHESGENITDANSTVINAYKQTISNNIGTNLWEKSLLDVSCF